MLLSATTIKAHYEMPEHIEISLLEHDLRICSKFDQNPSFFNSDKNPDYWLAIFTGSNLNLECLHPTSLTQYSHKNYLEAFHLIY